MSEEVLRGYAADAPELIPAYEALRPEEVLAPVLDLLPRRLSPILDVGAGTGRTAAWLAGHGHSVVASEPVAPLREAGLTLHPQLQWIGDRLPHLPAVSALGERFDLILVIGVWQHLPVDGHRDAIAVLSRLLAPARRLIISLRHGPGAASRPCYPASADDLCAIAAAEGLRLLRRQETGSIQQANRDKGVTWTWLVFEAA